MSTASEQTGKPPVEFTFAETKKRPARRTVDHLFDRDLLMQGVRQRSWCGLVWSSGVARTNPNQLQVVGGLMSVPKSDDCKSCVRAYEAYLRRRHRRLYG